MQHDELVGLSSRLQWGTPASRRELAEHLVQREDRATLALLADTVRSDEGSRLRARCLEVLGLAAAQADGELGEHILGLLLDPAPGSHRERPRVADAPAGRYRSRAAASASGGTP